MPQQVIQPWSPKHKWYADDAIAIHAACDVLRSWPATGYDGAQRCWSREYAFRGPARYDAPWHATRSSGSVSRHARPAGRSRNTTDATQCFRTPWPDAFWCHAASSWGLPRDGLSSGLSPSIGAAWSRRPKRPRTDGGNAGLPRHASTTDDERPRHAWERQSPSIRRSACPWWRRDEHGDASASKQFPPQGRGPMVSSMGQPAAMPGSSPAIGIDDILSSPPNQQKQMVGEALYPKVLTFQGERLAGKITGMLLEMDITELISL